MLPWIGIKFAAILSPKKITVHFRIYDMTTRSAQEPMEKLGWVVMFSDTVLS
jgi:hypothetical protein